MKFGPADCDLPAVAWDVLENKAITHVLCVDTDAKEVVIASPDENGCARIYLDKVVTERIGFQAIYPWPLTGKPHLFNCYYRKP